MSEETNSIRRPEQDDRSSADSGVPNPLVGFAIRVVVVVFTITAAFSWLIDTYKPDTANLKLSLRKSLSDQDTRLQLNGLLSGNPRVNWELSTRSEARGEFAKAYDDMLIAVGILEKANVRNEIMNPYTSRLEHLRKAIDKSSAPSAPVK
jgi:hypothetical protein